MNWYGLPVLWIMFLESLILPEYAVASIKPARKILRSSGTLGDATARCPSETFFNVLKGNLSQLSKLTNLERT